MSWTTGFQTWEDDVNKTSYEKVQVFRFPYKKVAEVHRYSSYDYRAKQGWIMGIDHLANGDHLRLYTDENTYVNIARIGPNNYQSQDGRYGVYSEPAQD